jgi:FMN phosphatase YigB (HAD superfamily)
MSNLDTTGSQGPPGGIVFLLDVDNTLLDNDYFEVALKDFLTQEFGAGNCDRYWVLLKALRTELGYVDYLGALQRYRWDLNDPRLLLISSFMLDYPFADRLYPGALDVLRRLRSWGLTVILSDGDVVFQPRKIQRSGLWAAVENRVLIYVRKETMLEAVMQRYPAQHYIMVDDKLGVLTAAKLALGDRVTTVLARQGHYALDPAKSGIRAHADLTLQGIGDLLNYDLPALLRTPAGMPSTFHEAALSPVDTRH